MWMSRNEHVPIFRHGFCGPGQEWSTFLAQRQSEQVGWNFTTFELGFNHGLKRIWVVVSNIFYFHPYLGKWSNLTNISQMGWNHQLRIISIHLWFLFVRKFGDLQTPDFCGLRMPSWRNCLHAYLLFKVRWILEWPDSHACIGCLGD